MKSVLTVRNLSVEIPTRHARLTALDDVSLEIREGEVLGLVGESGAGKSMTGNAIVGLLDPPSQIVGGEILYRGDRIDNLPYEQLRKTRGKEIGVVFQDPQTSLNPLFTIGQQLVETITTHTELTRRQARDRAIGILERVGIPGASHRISSYPHQFSGGMRQRVVIALAICANPRLVIADEPTTALDVSIQSQIVALLKDLCRERGTAIMLITHNMGLVAEMADRVAVMYAGRVVEVGPVKEVVANPKHPYARGLMNCIPRIGQNSTYLQQIDGSMPRLHDVPAGCSFNPRCPLAFQRCQMERPELVAVSESRSHAACWLYHHEGDAAPPPFTATLGRRTIPSMQLLDQKRLGVGLLEVNNLTKCFDVSKPIISRIVSGERRRLLHAVNDVSFRIKAGETFSLVGESGCGKSTVARLIVGLYRQTEGRITLGRSSYQGGYNRHRMQMIFQDPYASVNPRWKVRDIIAEPLRTIGMLSTGIEADKRVHKLLEQVGLDAADGDKYPHQFSGGQRQRISIARALSADPEFIVCDEPTSALDVSVQAQILNIMRDLQRRLGLTFLFISHDLSVIYHMSDTVAVMYLGRLVEVADKATLFSDPQHPYTRMLLDAIPDLGGDGDTRATAATGEAPSPLDPPAGCSFHPRCPFANVRCAEEVPLLKQSRAGSMVACHGVDEGRIPPYDPVYSHARYLEHLPS